MAAVRRRSAVGRLVAVLVVVWLIIGMIAAGQRHYFRGSKKPTCAHVSTTVITVIAGPLNYLGANPKVNCKVPEPST